MARGPQRGPLTRANPAATAPLQLSTEVVDKVVSNRWLGPINPRETSPLIALHKKSASFLTMEINHLHARDNSMTDAAPALALRRAAVEFPTRAVVGVSHV